MGINVTLWKCKCGVHLKAVTATDEGQPQSACTRSVRNADINEHLQQIKSSLLVRRRLSSPIPTDAESARTGTKVDFYRRMVPEYHPSRMPIRSRRSRRKIGVLVPDYMRSGVITGVIPNDRGQDLFNEYKVNFG